MLILVEAGASVIQIKSKSLGFLLRSTDKLTVYVEMRIWKNIAGNDPQVTIYFVHQLHPWCFINQSNVLAYLPLGSFPYSNMSAHIWCVPAIAIHRTSFPWIPETTDSRVNRNGNG